MQTRRMLLSLFVISTFSAAYGAVPVQDRSAPQTRPAQDGGQQGRPKPGGGKPGQGGQQPGKPAVRPNPGGSNRPNPGTPKPTPGRPSTGRPSTGRPSTGRPGNGQQPGKPGVRPNPGGGNNRPQPGRPPSRPSPGRPQPGRPGAGRPPQWGRPPANRPSYTFRPNDRSYLHRYYSRRLLSINRARRAHFVIGGYFPYGDIQYLSPLPPDVYGYLPPPPPGYQMGYYDGYVVVYDPVSYFIANLVDLLQ
jgi:hypothetical protein